jgi:hypothetical protein
VVSTSLRVSLHQADACPRCRKRGADTRAWRETLLRTDALTLNVWELPVRGREL